MKKILVIVLVSLIVLSCRKSSYVSYFPLNNGLVAYYPLDGNANDYTSNKNHGKTNAKVSSDRLEFSKRAYSFDTNYFQSSNIPINLSTKYTFSFWIKMKSYEDGMAIMELAKPTQSQPVLIPCNLNPQIWQYKNSMYLTTASNINNSIHIMSLGGIKSGTEIPTWKHVLWTVNNDTTTVYVNGYLKEKKVMPWPKVDKVNLTLANAGNTCTGDFGKSNFHNQPSKVFIDEVRIYNRVLNESEIQLLSKN